MAEIREWEEEIAKLPLKDIERHIESLSELLQWSMWEKEYGWTGPKLLRTLLQEELDRRNKDNKMR